MNRPEVLQIRTKNGPISFPPHLFLVLKWPFMREEYFFTGTSTSHDSCPAVGSRHHLTVPLT